MLLLNGKIPEMVIQNKILFQHIVPCIKLENQTIE